MRMFGAQSEMLSFLGEILNVGSDSKEHRLKLMRAENLRCAAGSLVLMNEVALGDW